MCRRRLHENIPILFCIFKVGRVEYGLIWEGRGEFFQNETEGKKNLNFWEIVALNLMTTIQKHGAKGQVSS